MPCLLWSAEKPAYLSQESRIWPLADSLTFPMECHDLKRTIQHILNDSHRVNVMIVTRSECNISESECSIMCSQFTSVAAISSVCSCLCYVWRSLCAMVRAIGSEWGLQAMGFDPAPSSYITPWSWESENSSKPQFSCIGWQHWPSRSPGTILTFLKGAQQLAVLSKVWGGSSLRLSS